MADGKVTIQVILDDKDVGKGTKKVEGTLKGIGNTAKRGIATVGKLAGALGLVGLAYKGIDMVKQSLDGAIDRYDTLNNFPRVMAQIGFDAQTSQKAIDKLSDGIQGLPTRLDEVASTAQSIAIMTGDLEGAVDTTLALNNAFLASGASTADAERGLEQYVQMLSKGEVDLQSWRTLQETMPFALRKTAEAFGFTGESATNDFYDALKSGEITMDEFNAKLIELDQAQGGFAETAQTSSAGIKTALTNMKTWFVMGIADILGAIDEAMGGVGSIEGAINSLKPVIQGVFGWIAETAIPAVATAIGFLVEAFNNAKEVIMEWLGDNEEGITSLWHTYEEYLTLIWGYVQEAFVFIKNIVEEILPPIVSFIGDILGQIFSFFSENGEQIIEAVDKVFGFIKTIVEFVMPIVGFIVQDVWNSIKNVIQGAIDIILGIIKTFSSLLTGDWKGVWDGIKQILSGAVQALWGLINLWFVGKIVKLGKTFIKLFQNIFRSGWNFIRNIFSSSVSTVQGIVSAGFNIIRSVISGIMNGIRGFISGVWNGIRSVVSSVVNSIRSVISSVFGSLGGIATRAFNSVRNAVSNGIRGAYNAVTNILGRFRDAGRRIVTSIADGIRGAIGQVKDAIGNVTSAIRNFLPFSPAKEGALRDIMNVRIAESIAETIDKGSGKAVSSMRKLAKKVSDEANADLLGDLKGISANSALAGFMPTSEATQQQIINNQVNAKRYDDSTVVQLLKQLVDKDGNVYINREKVGSIMDEEQARRIKALERRVAID